MSQQSYFISKNESRHATSEYTNMCYLQKYISVTQPKSLQNCIIYKNENRYMIYFPTKIYYLQKLNQALNLWPNKATFHYKTKVGTLPMVQQIYIISQVIIINMCPPNVHHDLANKMTALPK